MLSSSPGPVARVRGRRSFAALRRGGTRRRSGPIVITSLVDDSLPGPCVAYAIPRAVGPAVVRNRVRRRLRAAARELDLAPGTYLVAVAPAAATSSFDELRGHLRQACGR